MTEKSYYSKLTHYYTDHAKKIQRSISWEAKFTRSNRINFDALMPHQEEKLFRSTRVYGEKIADAGIMRKPFDGWVLFNAESYFIAIYFLPRETEIYEISIRNFVDEKYQSSEKSLTKQRASEIGKRIFL